MAKIVRSDKPVDPGGRGDASIQVISPTAEEGFTEVLSDYRSGHGQSSLVKRGAWMSARSYLFVPGDRPEVLAKASNRGADALIIDLEDAVAPSRKSKARLMTANWLERENQLGYERWVRVNEGRELGEDLAMLRGLNLDGIVIPKVAGPQELAETVGRFREVQPSGRVILLVETAKAVRSMDAIASIDGVYQLMLGEADLGADIGMTSESFHRSRHRNDASQETPCPEGDLAWAVRREVIQTHVLVHGCIIFQSLGTQPDSEA